MVGRAALSEVESLQSPNQKSGIGKGKLNIKRSLTSLADCAKPDTISLVKSKREGVPSKLGNLISTALLHITSAAEMGSSYLPVGRLVKFGRLAKLGRLGNTNTLDKGVNQNQTYSASEVEKNGLHFIKRWEIKRWEPTQVNKQAPLPTQGGAPATFNKIRYNSSPDLPNCNSIVSEGVDQQTIPGPWNSMHRPPAPPITDLSLLGGIYAPYTPYTPYTPAQKQRHVSRGKSSSAKNLQSFTANLKKMLTLPKCNSLSPSGHLNPPKLYTAYSKIEEIKLVTIEMASAEKIRQWAERILPNGKVVGEVMNSDTLHYKTSKPYKGGLFCERIFGPVNDFECACGKKMRPLFEDTRELPTLGSRLEGVRDLSFSAPHPHSVRVKPEPDPTLPLPVHSTGSSQLGNAMHSLATTTVSMKKVEQNGQQVIKKPASSFLDGFTQTPLYVHKLGPKPITTLVRADLGTNVEEEKKFCAVCDVQYTKSVVRRYQLGYIQLALPVTHVWYVKSIPSYMAIALGMKKKNLENLIYNKQTSILAYVLKSDLLAGPLPDLKEDQKSAAAELHAMWTKLMQNSALGGNLEPSRSPTTTLPFSNTVAPLGKLSVTLPVAIHTGAATSVGLAQWAFDLPGFLKGLPASYKKKLKARLRFNDQFTKKDAQQKKDALLKKKRKSDCKHPSQCSAQLLQRSKAREVGKRRGRFELGLSQWSILSTPSTLSTLSTIRFLAPRSLTPFYCTTYNRLSAAKQDKHPTKLPKVVGFVPTYRVGRTLPTVAKSQLETIPISNVSSSNSKQTSFYISSKINAKNSINNKKWGGEIQEKINVMAYPNFCKKEIKKAYQLAAIRVKRILNKVFFMDFKKIEAAKKPTSQPDKSTHVSGKNPPVYTRWLGDFLPLLVKKQSPPSLCSLPLLPEVSKVREAYRDLNLVSPDAIFHCNLKNPCSIAPLVKQAFLASAGTSLKLLFFPLPLRRTCFEEPSGAKVGTTPTAVRLATPYPSALQGGHIHTTVPSVNSVSSRTPTSSDMKNRTKLCSAKSLFKNIKKLRSCPLITTLVVDTFIKTLILNKGFYSCVSASTFKIALSQKLTNIEKDGTPLSWIEQPRVAQAAFFDMGKILRRLNKKTCQPYKICYTAYGRYFKEGTQPAKGSGHKFAWPPLSTVMRDQQGVPFVSGFLEGVSLDKKHYDTNLFAECSKKGEQSKVGKGFMRKRVYPTYYCYPTLLDKTSCLPTCLLPVLCTGKGKVATLLPLPLPLNSLPLGVALVSGAVGRVGGSTTKVVVSSYSALKGIENARPHIKRAGLGVRTGKRGLMPSYWQQVLANQAHQAKLVKKANLARKKKAILQTKAVHGTLNSDSALDRQGKGVKYPSLTSLMLTPKGCSNYGGRAQSNPETNAYMLPVHDLHTFGGRGHKIGVKKKGKSKHIPLSKAIPLKGRKDKHTFVSPLTCIKLSLLPAPNSNYYKTKQSGAVKQGVLCKPKPPHGFAVYSPTGLLVRPPARHFKILALSHIVNNLYVFSHREFCADTQRWDNLMLFVGGAAHASADSFPALKDISIPSYCSRLAPPLTTLPGTSLAPSLGLVTTRNTEVIITGVGVVQKLLSDFNIFERKKMVNHNTFLLYIISKKIKKAEKRTTWTKTWTLTKQQALIAKWQKRQASVRQRTKLYTIIRRRNTTVSSMVLSCLPVLPPELRPIVKTGDRTVISDLNKLYQQVIFRNDRLKRFLKNMTTSDSEGHEIKYAQRLLQEAVDNLIQNGKSGVEPEVDAKGRLFKSLSDGLKGKQGRFRQYLLGKRLDYSGRSVIVVGPKLKLHQCGIPKEMAKELYLPFLLKRILNDNLARTVIGAKIFIKNNETVTCGLLREIMQVGPVLLNRAPTLHRLGFQAFQPKLVEGKAILLHPLVCAAFNADFDGDQMAVHVPITVEARAEAWKLMLARNNVLSAATGEPIAIPSQDMVLGCYFLTTYSNKTSIKHLTGSSHYFSNLNDVLKAYNQQLINVHAVIWVKWDGRVEGPPGVVNSLATPSPVRNITSTYAEKLSEPLARKELNSTKISRAVKPWQDSTLEIRLMPNGKRQEINSEYLKTFDCFGFPINQYIRTTPGRVVFNTIIKDVQTLCLPSTKSNKLAFKSNKLALPPPTLTSAAT